MDTNLDKNIRSKNDVAKMLVHAATLMEIIDDYSNLQKMSKNEDVFLSRSKAKLADIKSQLSKAGYKGCASTQASIFDGISIFLYAHSRRSCTRSLSLQL